MDGHYHDAHPQLSPHTAGSCPVACETGSFSRRWAAQQKQFYSAYNIHTTWIIEALHYDATFAHRNGRENVGGKNESVSALKHLTLKVSGGARAVASRQCRYGGKLPVARNTAQSLFMCEL